MLRGFARADKNHRDVRATSLPQHGILIDVDCAQRGAEFTEHRLDQCFRFLAKMTTRARVQRNYASLVPPEPLIFMALIHVFAPHGESRGSVSNRTRVFADSTMARADSIPSANLRSRSQRHCSPATQRRKHGSGIMQAPNEEAQTNGQSRSADG